MVLYNVTVNIDDDVESDWVHWMKNEQINSVMKTGFFAEYKFLRMLSESPDATGATYAVQFIAKTMGHLETYLSTVAPKLQKRSVVRYGTKMAAFRTVLEEV